MSGIRSLVRASAALLLFAGCHTTSPDGGDLAMSPPDLSHSADLSNSTPDDLTMQANPDFTGVPDLEPIFDLNAGDLTTAMPTCVDNLQNGKETDIDCGGPMCPKCGVGRMCAMGSDCSTLVCTMGACVADSCMDQVKNGNETDTDCGGSCPVCGDNLGCKVPGDCNSGVCNNMKCTPPACNDQIKNGGESDVDCGGLCGKCADGKKCGQPADCASGVCMGGVCTSAACNDGQKNGQETDTDCGGAMCNPCAAGKVCKIGGDCSSKVCQNGICSVPSCMDTVKNGAESDVDCGGGMCVGCALGKACAVAADCASSFCSKNFCATAVSCKDLKSAAPALKDGIYSIDPDGNGNNAPFQVFCEMTTDGGGWTFFAHVNNNYVGGNLFVANVGAYRTDRGDDNTTYSRSLGILPYISHTNMMVTLDQADPAAALIAKKIVFFQYPALAQAFNAGPIPCVGLNAGFAYRTVAQGLYTAGGTTNSCNGTTWYTRTVGNAQYLILFNNQSTYGNYHGAGMGGNNTWNHDGFWYVR